MWIVDSGSCCMQPESPKLLEDVRMAASFVEEQTRGKSLDEYLADELLRAAIERKFEIIGEALVRIRKVDPQTVNLIPDHSQIIAFRNVLIHGYDAIDHRRVWDAIRNSLPQLMVVVVSLLNQVQHLNDSAVGERAVGERAVGERAVGDCAAGEGAAGDRSE